MKQKVFLSFIISLFSIVAAAQVTITVPSGTDTTVCNGAPLTLQARNLGYSSHLVPTLGDDTYSALYPIGFSFNYYGTTYTDFVICSNGYITFRTSVASSGSGYTIGSGIPTNTSIRNSICGAYMDLLPSSGGTISYGLSGVAPSRKLVVSFCDVHYFNCTSNSVTFQIILYEGSNVVEIHTKKRDACTSWNGGYCIQGLENSGGTAGTPSPGRNYPTLWTVTVPDGKRFAPDATVSSYTCTTIPYAPLPDSNAVISWYNGTTLLGTGTSVVVNPTVPTTYTAMAISCGDTSRDAVSVIIGTGPSISSITATAPTVCGICDGTVTLHGLVAGSSDTIKYYLGSVLQPVFVGVPNAAGDLTITGLCAGTYTNFTAKVGYCTSSVYASVVVPAPPFNIGGVTSTNPTVCGICDGTITISGLVPGYYDTVNYIKNGVPQTPVVLLVPASGSIVIPGICAANYTGITVKMNNCIATVPDVTPIDPPFTTGAVTTSNPTVCGICNGSISIGGLVAGYYDTVTYYKDGILQPRIVLLVPASGIITLTGLCAGSYTGIIVKMNSCPATAASAVLVNAPFTISSTSFTDPTACGACDGTITINGLVAGYYDTVSFSKDGVPQPPQVFLIGATGSITLNGLCAGVYSGITVKMNSCSASASAVTLTNPAFNISGITYVNPTVCGVCDGSITINGLVPGHYDTINYVKDGVPQPRVVFLISATGSVTLTNLCAGVYTNITATMNTCVSSPFAATLTNPSFTISSTSNTNPSVCGACDATITINGLIPGYSDTVRYTKDGVPQTAVLIVPSSGTIVLTNLCAGVYANITVKMNNCTTPSVGPITLVNPFFGITDTSSVNATCSACDGTFTLYGLTPNVSVTVNYSYNGVPQPAWVVTTSASGTVTKTGLCPGTYSNISARLNTCVSNTVGSFVISAPPLIPIAIQSYTDPTECGLCNGKIVIKGAPPGPIDTIFYNYGAGVATPVLYSSSPDSVITMYNLCAGDYHNFFIKVGPCPTTTITTHTILSAPTLTAGFTYSTVYGCAYDVVTFTNTSANNATSGPGTLWYVWDFGDGTTDTAPNPVHVYTTQGTYVVTLTATNHVCAPIASQTIILNHPVNAAFTSDTVTCQHSTVVFNNGSTGAPTPITYLWTFGDGTSSNATNPSHVFTNVGTYHVQLVTTNGYGCSDVASTNIFVDSQSKLSLSLSDTVLCRGTYVTLYSEFSNVGLTGYTMDLGNGESVSNINPVIYAYQNPGTYVITTTANFRICPTLTSSQTVIVVPQPDIILGSDTAICAGSETIYLEDLVNVSNGAASWLWNTGATTYNILVSEPGVYVSTVTIGNCKATDTVTVSDDCYMALPNIFTPNGDGLNDYFYPRSVPVFRAYSLPIWISTTVGGSSSLVHLL